MNILVSSLEINALSYRSLIASATATFLFIFLTIFSIVCDKVHEHGVSGHIVIITLSSISLSMAYWCHMELKQFRKLVGPLFLPNPGYPDNRGLGHRDWIDMGVSRYFGGAAILIGLLMSFSFGSLTVMLIALGVSISFFYEAEKSAKRVRETLRDMKV